MRKSKNRVYRWIAVVMTAALLVGQCQVPVLAKEESAPAETGVSDEIKADTQEDGAGVTDKDAPKESDTDNSVTRHFIVDGKSILFSTVSTPLRHLLFADRALLSTKLSSQIEIFRFKLCVQ